MTADYSALNPNLDKRVIPLFPYDGHLWAYMRCVLFHPDYAPFIPFGEQFPLAEKIVNDYKGYVLTVGDIIYYVACFVEKREPSPPGVTRSTLTRAPRKIAQQSGISDLLTAEPNTAFAHLMDGIKQNADPDINAQKLTSTLYDLIDECAPPKETAAVKQTARTIQDFWERSESGTIRNEQRSCIQPANRTAPTGPIAGAKSAPLELDALFCDKTANSEKPIVQPKSLTGLFAPKAIRIESNLEAAAEKAPSGNSKTLIGKLGGLFSKQPKEK